MRFLRYGMMRGALANGALFVLCQSLVSCVTDNSSEDIAAKAPYKYFVDISKKISKAIRYG